MQSTTSQFIAPRIVTIALWMYVLSYVNDLEQTMCVCSDTWQRHYIKFYLLVVIIYIITNMLVDIPQWVVRVGAFIGILFVVILFQFLRKLKKTKCECSEGPKRELLEIINKLQILLLLSLCVSLPYVVLFSFRGSKQNTATLKALQGWKPWLLN